MTPVAIIQARMASTRLPGKVLMQAHGKPILAHVVERVASCVGKTNLLVATTNRLEDAAVAAWCAKNEIQCLTWTRILPDGSNDVLARFARAAKLRLDADAFLRVTADCPLWCPKLGAEVLTAFEQRGVHYCSNVCPEVDGFDTEVFSRQLLISTNRLAELNHDRQHVTPYMRKFSLKYYVDHKPLVGGRKLSLDTPEDFERIRTVLERVRGLTYKDTLQAMEGL